MKKLIIPTRRSVKKYPIFIGHALICKISELFDLAAYSQILIVSDENTGKLFNLNIRASHVSLHSGEINKSLQSVELILNKLHEMKADRKTLIVNVGGGNLCDTSSFAASIYMRGIDVLQIPTTLLAQVDASIGGKTGINFAGLKNLVGTFKNPIGVIIDLDFLKTLPEREYLSGFAEIIKHALIFDRKYFLTLRPTLKFSDSELEKIIEKSCKIKAKIVTADPEEKNVRKILNFGHTIGHALEALSLENPKPLLHGEAIFLGMIVENRISYLSGILNKKDFLLIDDFLKKIVKPIEFDSEKICKKILYDKKNEFGHINFTLLKSIGAAVYNHQVDEKIIIEDLNYENN